MIAWGKNKKQTQRAKNRAKIYKKRTIKKRSFVSCCFFGLGIANCQAGSFSLVCMLLQHSFLDKALWLDHLRCGQTT